MWRATHPRTPKRPAPICAFCGLSRGNSLGIGVYRYPLVRCVFPIRSNRCIGSLSLCDRCVVDYAAPSPSYVRANGRGWGRAA